MQVVYDRYQKTSLIRPSGESGSGEFRELLEDLEKAGQAGEADEIFLLDLTEVKLQDSDIEDVKAARAKEKSPLRLISPSLEDADARDLPTALDSIKTSDASDIKKILELRTALSEKKSELEEIEKGIQSILHEAGEKDVEADKMDSAVNRLLKKEKTLDVFFEGFKDSIKKFNELKITEKKSVSVSEQDQAEFKAARKKVFDFFKSKGITE